MLEQILIEINPKIKELESHSIYKKINSNQSLKLFMQRHVYAVFDFMSLTKAIQCEFSPIEKVWTPPKNREISRFINEIILAEESDEGMGETHMSHFELYCQAMEEVSADTSLIEAFVDTVIKKDIDFALTNKDLPKSAQSFMKDTFALIDGGKIHEIAASFCFGREQSIPLMFQSLLDEMNITKSEAPAFHYYLNRHIEIDGDSHGPLALKMLTILCGTDKKKWKEVKVAALSSIESRIKFWDEISMEVDEALILVNPISHLNTAIL